MNPGLIWFLFVAVYMGWHDPSFYNYALRHAWLHDIQHLSFFLAALPFWWYIVGGAPHLHGYGGVWGRLAMLVGVIPAQMIAGITIATASQVIYTYYESVPRFWGISTLRDQTIAGAIMWIPSSEMVVWGVVFLLAGYFKREEKLGSEALTKGHKKDVMVAS
jgi:putative membrane protein